MTLKELIQNNSWLSVQLTFINLYPEQERLIEDYEMVYAELQVMEPELSEMCIETKRTI
jgi:hypothetical protein